MPEISQTLSKKMIKKFLSIMLLGTTVLTTNAQTQVTNGDFETWTLDGDNLPNNWNSFQTADGSFASAGYSSSNRQVQKSTDIRPGSTGQSSVRIWTRTVFSIPAQGNLTSGRVHAGSMTAANKNNYNYSDRDGSNTINGVVNPCAMKFTGHPDAVSVWVKFNRKGGDNTARFAAFVHDDHDYITYGLESDDTETNKSYVVASAEKNFEPCDWTNLVLPFNYTGNEDARYILVNASPSSYPGKGKANDELYIDDIEMIYYHALSDLKYNGQTVAGFNEETKDYDLTDQVYDESKVSWTVKGHAATVSKAFNATTGKLRLTVKNNDSGESTVYTLSFKTASATLFVSTAAKYATFIAPFNLSIPSSIPVDAYTVDNINANGTLVMTKLGKNIPANIPVVLYSTRTSDYTRTASGAFVPATNNLTEGLLTGTYEEIDAPVDSYVMQNHDGRVGFFHVAAGKQPKVAPNRCYLTVPAGSAAPAFFFEEDETNGIGNINMTTDNTIYDLQGRRVATPTKGLYIINGKKVVIR